MVGRYQGIPRGVLEHPELVDVVLPALRADMELLETYAYRDTPPFDCPIWAFAGERDALVREAKLRRWGNHTRREFSCRLFAGDHFYLNEARRELLDEIRPHLV